MKTLFIDTHLSDIHIILFLDNKIYKEEHVLGKRQNSVFLMPSVKKVIDNEKIDEIIVVNGPGSFTGVRLGVTIAKTLAYTLNIPIKVISYLKMMNISSQKDIVAFTDENGFFVGNYTKEENMFYLKNEEYKEYSKNNLVETDVIINYEKVLEYLKDINNINAHEVKPIYVKLIGVECDKTSK